MCSSRWGFLTNTQAFLFPLLTDKRKDAGTICSPLLQVHEDKRTIGFLLLNLEYLNSPWMLWENLIWESLKRALALLVNVKWAKKQIEASWMGNSHHFRSNLDPPTSSSPGSSLRSCTSSVSVSFSSCFVQRESLVFFTIYIPKTPAWSTFAAARFILTERPKKTSIRHTRCA